MLIACVTAVSFIFYSMVKDVFKPRGQLGGTLSSAAHQQTAGL